MSNSRSSFDYARQNRSSSSTITKRKRKFNTTKLPSFSFRSRTSSTVQLKEAQEPASFLNRMIHFIVAVGLVAVLVSIVMNRYPADVKDVLITNGYLLVVFPFFASIYCFLYALSGTIVRPLLIALFFTIILFLKLQMVMLKISLILPLFVIFAIIGMLYSRKSTA